MSPPSSWSRNEPSKSTASYLLLANFLLGLLFDPEDGGDMFLRNVSSLLNGLHGVIFQKTELFITML
jgi:hypothetical protein